MSKADSIGIMDKAFFVGKNEILGWLNEFFDVSKLSTCPCCRNLFFTLSNCLFVTLIFFVLLKR